MTCRAPLGLGLLAAATVATASPAGFAQSLSEIDLPPITDQEVEY